MNKNNVYMFFIDTSSGIMKTIGMLDTNDVVDLESTEPHVSIGVNYMRMLNKSESSIGLGEIFPYSADDETYVMKSKIVSYAKTSSTMAAVFLDNIERTTKFITDRNIPHFNNDENISIDRVIN